MGEHDSCYCKQVDDWAGQVVVEHAVVDIFAHDVEALAVHNGLQIILYIKIGITRLENVTLNIKLPRLGPGGPTGGPRFIGPPN